MGKQCVAIRETWLKDLKDRGIPYLFVVGGGQGELKRDVLELDVSEQTEFKIEKSLQLFEWVLNNTRAQYMVKVSDGSFLCVERYFDSLSYRKYHYYGKI
ncbi:MAG: hypothetical protein GWN00_16430, partial [Aliifodinibius sp.]|nr:hypothetical protein [Fodinibius sp.]NIY26333.1 hypothetical protein [Fodinibius sp.]